MFVQPGSRGKPAGPRPSDKSGKAAPAKLGDLLGGNDSSPHWVQLNSVRDAQESGGVFYERGLIAALKKMSAFGPKPVEASGQGSLQPVHAIAQVRNGCGQSQVEMVSQNQEGVDFPPKSGAGLA
ncbi:MAG: hypothetical protein RL077_1664 [Verrucomicrobiota bacterium]|jgi:hypothetical protein